MGKCGDRSKSRYEKLGLETASSSAIQCSNRKSVEYRRNLCLEVGIGLRKCKSTEIPHTAEEKQNESTKTQGDIKFLKHAIHGCLTSFGAICNCIFPLLSKHFGDGHWRRDCQRSKSTFEYMWAYSINFSSEMAFLFQRLYKGNITLEIYVMWLDEKATEIEAKFKMLKIVILDQFRNISSKIPPDHPLVLIFNMELSQKLYAVIRDLLYFVLFLTQEVLQLIGTYFRDKTMENWAKFVSEHLIKQDLNYIVFEHFIHNFAEKYSFIINKLLTKPYTDEDYRFKIFLEYNKQSMTLINMSIFTLTQAVLLVLSLTFLYVRCYITQEFEGISGKRNDCQDILKIGLRL